MNNPQSKLDEPDYAAFAWARFRHILRWMTLAAFVSAIVSVLILWLTVDELTAFIAIATGLGVFLTVLAAAGLMGLMFLSSGSGHDAAVDEMNRERTDPGEQVRGN